MILYYLYLSLLCLFFPIFLVRVYCRQQFYAKNSAVKIKNRLKERVGFFDAPALHHPIWIHAVSYGEAVLAEQMVNALKAKFPDQAIVVTTTTLTGSERIQKTLGKSVFHVFLPYDLPLFVQQFIKKINPSMLVILETELWPALIRVARQANIPIFLANARLSEKSAQGYRYVLSLARFMLKDLTLVAAQSERDANRFLQLGLSPSQLKVLGSIKYDLKVPSPVWEASQQLKEAIGKARLIWVASSTHEGEEQEILNTFDQVKKVYPDAVLILVPRHPERFEAVAELCERSGYRIVKRSLTPLPSANLDIFLGDTLGELLIFYAAADVAFVGGSLVPIGGHNVLEAIAVDVPVLTGPYFQNFTDMIETLKRHSAIQIVETSEDLAECIMKLMQDSKARSLQVEQARKVLLENQGALDKHIACITQLSCYLQKP